MQAWVTSHEKGTERLITGLRRVLPGQRIASCYFSLVYSLIYIHMNKTSFQIVLGSFGDALVTFILNQSIFPSGAVKTEFKSNPFYAGRETNEDACTSLVDWLSQRRLLVLFVGGDSGSVKLARERLRGEALDSWRLWRRDSRVDSWISLADNLGLMYSPLPCVYTSICKFLRARRHKGELL